MKTKILKSLISLTVGISLMSMQASAAATTADEFTQMLRTCHMKNEPVDEWRIKPAEFSEDGTLPYVSLMHLQDLDGLLIRCTDEAAPDEFVGNRKIMALNEFIEVYDRTNALEGRIRNESRDQLPAEYRNDDIYVVEFIFGLFPSEEEQSRIVQSVLDNPKLELLGVLQTDWYIKGYYDEMNTGLYIVPEDGFEISSDDLNTEAYHYLNYEPKLSDYQLSYIRDLPDNTGYATITKDNMEFEEVTALCDALEAREDIAYAWIAPVYLNDKLSNPGDYGYSIKLFEANTPEITDPEYTVTTTETTVFADYTGTTTTEETTVFADYTGTTTTEKTTVFADYTGTTTTTTEPTEPQAGDLSGDGEIAADDAQIALKAYVNVLAGKGDGLTEAQRKAADIDGDGEVTSSDAQIILKYYVETLAGKTPAWNDLIPEQKNRQN